MPKTEMLHIRIEPEIKDHADRMFHALGISTSEAIKIFLAAALRAGGLPFDVIAPEYRYNEETIAAMKEARHIARDPNTKRYSDFGELLKEIDDEIAVEEKASCRN